MELASDFAESVDKLVETMIENPAADEFDAAMKQLVKKYVDFEKIIADR